MSTKFSFPFVAIHEFEQRNAVSFQLTKEQMISGEEKGSTKLTKDQLLSVAAQINVGTSLDSFVQENADNFNPLSVTLFVFNDAVWKLMDKKEESKDTMLPMATIPGFFWKLAELSQGNRLGVRRDDYHKSSCIFKPNHSLSLMGSGGDFCGIIEAQLADYKPDARPVIAPHLPGPTNPVPKYEAQDIGVSIDLSNISTEIYTNPQKRMDYTFSEHPKIFYEHGIAIVTDGQNVTLRVGGRKPQNLYGDVWVLFGKRWKPESNPVDIIHFHVWLNALYSSLQ